MPYIMVCYYNVSLFSLSLFLFNLGFDESPQGILILL